MRLRNSAVPGVDPVSGADDRNGWSPDMVAEADALARSIAQLTADVQSLSDRAARLHQAGHAEGEWLLARFQTHRLASPDLSGPSARMILQASLSALEEHRAGLARDLAELDRLEAAAEATRKEAEQTRARREAEGARARTRTATAEARPAAADPARARAAAQPLGRISAPVAVGPGRSAARFPLQTQVDLSSDSNVFTGFSTNLSEGGLFVATLSVLPVGTPVDLTFTLPGKVKISVRGEVRWIREIDDRTPDVFPGVGVRFLDLTAEASAALHRFVASREPLFYPD
jgi:uncharacterized protein (TIGR02266 family)